MSLHYYTTEVDGTSLKGPSHNLHWILILRVLRVGFYTQALEHYIAYCEATFAKRDSTEDGQALVEQ